MRPVRLVLAAFGPYVEEQVLDFRVLKNNPLFLVNGPTGAGKTMLLDAMCYALFGECSGAVRDARNLRSQHAPHGQRTEVTFDFSLGAERYRIRRSPEQLRPKARGTGLTKEDAQAVLWRRTGLAGDEAEGEVVAAQPARVSAEIERILNFSSDQFRQVTVLPQGDFQRFLQSTSKDREEILEVLFQTGEYRRVEETLSARAKSCEQEVRIKAAARDVLLSQAGVVSRSELEQKLEQLGGELDTAAVALDGLREKQKAAHEAWVEAREADRRLKELRDGERGFDALYARQAEMEARSAELDRARRAAQLVPAERERVTRLKEAGDRREDAASARKLLADAVAAREIAGGVLAREVAREPEREEALRHEQALETLVGKVDQLGEARLGLETARQDHRRKRAESGDARMLLERLRGDIERGQQEIAELEKQAAPLEMLRVAVRELAAAQQRRAELDDARKDLADIRRTADAADRAAGHAAAKYAAAREELQQLEGQWVEGQAALLAASLVEGAPCPVCGSAVHPAPARMVQGVPGEAELKRKREACSRLEAARDSAAAVLQSERLRAAALESSAAEKARALGEMGALESEEIARRLAAQTAARDLAERAAVQLARAKSALEELRAGEIEARRGVEAADAVALAAGLEEARWRATVEERESAVPENLRAPGALEAALFATRSRLQRLRSALESAQREAAEAAQRVSSAEGRTAEMEASAVKAGQAAEVQAEAFEQALRAAGFATHEAFHAAVRTSPQIEALDRAVQQFRGALEAAADRLRRAREQAAGAAAPELDKVERALEEANATVNAALRSATALEARRDEARHQLEQLDRLATEFEQLETRRRRIARLAEAAGGHNNFQITFQRFVQATMLDRVLASASARLLLMSKNRYQFQRAANTLDRRTSGGLDLEVFDAHTGQARRVSTLSGGESFLASLSLALGLADVVQSHAGGLHLESIFIDEGFGSLDPEALELALRALRDLQQGGRLVGIISHVPELKEQINVRLEVKPHKGGSVARWSFTHGF